MAGLATAILRGLTTHEHLDDLLSRGTEVADPYFVDPLGRYLVHVAADAGDVSALRWLLSHGADPRQTTTTPRGETALHLAAAEGYREVVAFLLEEACVGVAGVNGAGQTALDVAVEAGHDDVVRLLTRHLPVTPPPPPPPSRATDAAGAASPVAAAPAAAANELPDIKARGSSSRQIQAASPAAKNTTTICATSGSLRAQGPKDGNAKRSDGAVAGKPTSRTPSPKEARPRKTGGGGRSPFDERAMTGGGFFVAGAWSKAGACSCFNVRHKHLLGKHGVVFDMGVCPSQVRDEKASGRNVGKSSPKMCRKEARAVVVDESGRTVWFSKFASVV